MRIQIFKLLTGEEIIAKGERDEKSRWVLKDVRTVTRIPIQSPQGVSFMNVLADYFGGSNTTNLTLLPEHVVGSPVDARDDLEKVYLKTVSGLILAK